MKSRWAGAISIEQMNRQNRRDFSTYAWNVNTIRTIFNASHQNHELRI